MPEPGGDKGDELVLAQKAAALSYFSSSDMARLYPELFKILWQSTLPCLAGSGLPYMLRECSLAGASLPCHTIFTRVPTDSGDPALALPRPLCRHVLRPQQRGSSEGVPLRPHGH